MDNYQLLNKKKKQLEDKNTVYLALLFFTILVLLVLLLGKDQYSLHYLLLSPFIIIFFILSILSYLNYQKLLKDFKTDFIPTTIKSKYPDCRYVYNHGFTKLEIEQAQIVDLQTNFQSKDAIFGIYKGIKFKSADVCISNKKNFKTIPTFLGRVYEFDFTKKIRPHVIIAQPNNYVKPHYLTEVDLKNNYYETQLKVYTNKPKNISNIITKDFMKSLIKLDYKYDDKIRFSIYQGKLYVAINSGFDMFEVRKKQYLTTTFFQELYSEFDDINDFLTDLLLHTTLFTKNTQ